MEEYYYLPHQDSVEREVRGTVPWKTAGDFGTSFCSSLDVSLLCGSIDSERGASCHWRVLYELDALAEPSVVYEWNSLACIPQHVE